MIILRECTQKNILEEKLKEVCIKKSRYIISKEYCGGMLLVNTYSDSIIYLNNHESEIFKTISDGEFLKQTQFYKDLYEQGMIIETVVNEFKTIEKNMLDSSKSSKNADVYTIYPTQRCNAKCAYCFEINEKKVEMNEETIAQTIKFLSNNINCKNRTIFRWFGGEPLLAKDTIDKIMEYVNCYYGEELNFQSMLTTNGLLLDKEIIDNAISKWHLSSVHLTIDGYRIHHARRKGYYNNDKSYEELLRNIEYLIECKIMVVCRINIDKSNFGQLDSIIADLRGFANNKYFKADIVPLRGENAVFYDISEYREVYIEVYKKFYQYDLLKCYVDVIPKRLFENCVAGVNNSIVINAEGNFYKCVLHSTKEIERFGNVKLGVTNEYNCKKWIDVNIHQMCQECSLLPICFGGCKEFWNNQNSGGTPCRNIKYYYEKLMDLIYEEDFMKINPK